jgi:hypothetical protein
MFAVAGVYLFTGAGPAIRRIALAVSAPRTPRGGSRVRPFCWSARGALRGALSHRTSIAGHTHVSRRAPGAPVVHGLLSCHQHYGRRLRRAHPRRLRRRRCRRACAGLIHTQLSQAAHSCLTVACPGANVCVARTGTRGTSGGQGIRASLQLDGGQRNLGVSRGFPDTSDAGTIRTRPNSRSP